MTAADVVLGRLQGVRQSAPGRWMARCPAHADKTASLSVRELEDGRVLLHDFAGCSVEDVLASIGLQLSALFEKRIDSAGPQRDRSHWHATRAALEAMRDEARIVVLVASDVAEGNAVSATDADRVAVAAGRIFAAVEVLYGR